MNHLPKIISIIPVDTSKLELIASFDLQEDLDRYIIDNKETLGEISLEILDHNAPLAAKEYSNGYVYFSDPFDGISLYKRKTV
jgi:hypothetical protein